MFRVVAFGTLSLSLGVLTEPFFADLRPHELAMTGFVTTVLFVTASSLIITATLLTCYSCRSSCMVID